MSDPTPPAQHPAGPNPLCCKVDMIACDPTCPNAAPKPAGLDVDTAAIRGRLDRGDVRSSDLRIAIAALAARDEELEKLKRGTRVLVQEHNAELRELRARWAERNQRVVEVLDQRDDARARLEEIRALHRLNGQVEWDDVRAILDREA